MKKIRILLSFTLLTFIQFGCAQTKVKDEINNVLSNKEKIELIEEIQQYITENYVEQKKVSSINKALIAYTKTKEFKSLNTTQEFAKNLGKHISEAANDPHFRLTYNPQLHALMTSDTPMMSNGPIRRVVPADGNENSNAQGTPQGQPIRKVVRQGDPNASGQPTGQPVRRVVTQDNTSNSDEQAMGQPIRRVVTPGSDGLTGSGVKGFMEEPKILDGNVGYFKINRMPSINDTKNEVDNAFKKLQNIDALIFDLRGNGGGVAGFIPYVMSYLFDEEGKLLYHRELANGEIREVKTEKTLSGLKLSDIPLYILVDRFTGSAATNMAYTLQKFNKATLIGEPSGVGTNGANTAMGFPLHNNLILNVPFAKVVHAKTKANWNMVGLIPNYETSAEESMHKAQELALQKIGKGHLVKSIVTNNKNNPTNPKLDKYVGSYEGNRVVKLNNGVLEMQRGNNLALPLKKLDENKFDFNLPPNAYSPTPMPIVEFTIENGEVTEMVYVRKDGSIEERIKKLK